MLTPTEQSALTRYSLRCLDALRANPDLDAGKRLQLVQQLTNGWAEAMNERLIIIEDVEAAMLMNLRDGERQVKRRILERWKARTEAERGYGVSDHEIIAMTNDTVDVELLVSGLRFARPE